MVTSEIFKDFSWMHFTFSNNLRIMYSWFDLEDSMVGSSVNKKKEEKQMKNTKKVVAQIKNTKQTKKVVAVAPASKTVAVKQPTKAQKVNPSTKYTVSEARSILRLGNKSHIVPSKFSGIHVRDGHILGSDIIAHLEQVSKPHGRGRRSFVKIGRRYPSGTVTVVAR